jgi:hypothetical protein
VSAWKSTYGAVFRIAVCGQSMPIEMETPTHLKMALAASIQASQCAVGAELRQFGTKFDKSMDLRYKKTMDIIPI